MKNAKKLVLITTSIIIAGMIILYSCKSYTGPGKRNIFEENQESQGMQIMNPDSQRVVVWRDACIIPALTVMKDNILIAAVGSKTKGQLLIKESKDNGKNWTEVNAPSIGTDLNNSYVHPFFINCHNGDILLGVSTTNASQNSLYLYRSTDGKTWNQELTNIVLPNKLTNFQTKPLDNKNAIVTYGNGIALKHGTNTSKNTLLFPYYYKTEIEVQNGQIQGSVATMISTDDGQSWQRYGNDRGGYVSYISKFIELNDGNILYFMNNAFKQVACFVSTDCGKTDTEKTPFTSGAHNEDKIEYFDFARYEFDGRDIKGAEYALMVFSTDKTSYSVKMTTDDFNKGQNKRATYLGGGSKVIAEGLTNSNDIYPTITVLKDGTIATLAAEDDGMVFRRFELNWFLEDELWMEQE